MNYYVHEVPGRLRVRSPLIRRNTATAQHAERLIAQLRGIRSTSVSTTTGSVVVHYCPKTIGSGEILAALEADGLFDRKRAVSHEAYINTSASRAGKTVGRLLAGLAVEKALEAAGLGLVAALT